MLTLVICSRSHLLYERWCGISRHGRDQVASSEEAQPESDGVIFELLSATRKNEIDSLRESIFCRILDNFSLKLKKEHMVQQRKPDALSKSQSGGAIQNIPEEGSQNDDTKVDDDIESNDNSLEEYTHIVIPYPGVDTNGNKTDSCKGPNDSNETREVPIFCAICLSEYEVSDEVCWSSYSHCTHVFHKDCIAKWLVSLGRRKSKMRRFTRTPGEKRLLDYQLECPCCRQEFIAGNCIVDA